MLRATTTLVPTEKPINIFNIRFIIAAVVPIDPIAPGTPDMPAMTISAALYSTWSMFVAMSGSIKPITLPSKGPSSMLMSLFRFFIMRKPSVELLGLLFYAFYSYCQ